MLIVPARYRPILIQFNRLSSLVTSRNMSQLSGSNSPSTPKEVEGGMITLDKPHSPPVGDDLRATKRPRLHSPSPASPTTIKLTAEGNINERKVLPYGEGLHLAPMVRIGTLPTRLLALEYGAGLVWGPEIVDKAIIGAERTVDPKSGAVRFTRSSKPIYETHPYERPRTIFQLGSSSPELAVQAAKVVEKDVDGIGLNCGCPKSFSISGGMGAALLKEPEKLCSILVALVQAFPTKPIDCKIRLLPTQESTLSLVSQIIATGISNLTVHCRTQDMRSTEPALHTRLREIVQLVTEKTGGKVPVAANGDCIEFTDGVGIRELTGVKAVMIARGAERNVSCFREGGLLDPRGEVMPLYSRVAMAVGNHYSNSKYVLNTMNPSSSTVTSSKRERSELKQALNKAKTYEDLSVLFGVKFRVEGEEKLEDLLPNWSRRRAELIAQEGELEGEE